MITSIMSSSAGKKAFGSIIRMWLLTLLVLTICTCSGPRLMLGNQTLGKQTDYSLYSGKLVKQTSVVTECATLRIDDLDSPLCLQLRRLTLQQFSQIHGLEYCPNLVLMQKRCLQTRSFRYQSTTRSFSNQFRTVWTGQRQSLRTEYPRQSTPVRSLRQTNRSESLTVSTPRSTGRTQGTTRTTGRN